MNRLLNTTGAASLRAGDYLNCRNKEMNCLGQRHRNVTLKFCSALAIWCRSAEKIQIEACI